MNKNQLSQKAIWMIIAGVSLGYGIGRGISNYTDHGVTFPVIMQIGGGILGLIAAFALARKK